MAKKKKAKVSTASGSAWGKIYGSMIGKGADDSEAAAVAYKALKESKARRKAVTESLKRFGV